MAGPAGGFCLGLLFYFNQEDQRLGISHRSDYRRVFLYGILFMLPTLFFFDFRLGLERLTIPTNLVNLLFLGLGASALCFVTWNFAVKILGALKTSVYIYMVPVITVITSVLILHETITPLSGVGIGCTFVGLLLSEYKGKALSQPNKICRYKNNVSQKHRSGTTLFSR